MADYPYIMGPNILKRFIQEIPSTGVPDRMTTVELESRGYKSHNYRVIIPILKFISFVDASGKPTDSWTNYRNKEKSGAVMAQCVRAAYSDLFKTYANAQDKDSEALRNFFSTRVKGSDNVLNWTVGTFKALCELSDFKATGTDSGSGEEEEEGEVEDKPKKKMTMTVPSAPSGMTVNLNIQLVLPTTENAEIYEKFFAAMKKHLLDAEKT